jgi:hypothetical protein
MTAIDWWLIAAVATFAGLAAAACYRLEHEEEKHKEAAHFRRIAARPSTTTHARNGEGR